LWRGPALPEFPAGPLAGWAARLGAAHRTALADRAELGGGSDRLAAEVAADPCWERGALVLARMLPAAEATAVLRGHAEAVVEVLGLDPSPAVRDLQAELARGTGAAGGGDASVGTGFSPAGAQRPRAGPEVALPGRDVAVGVPRYVSSFIGRDGERAALLGAGGLVTVAGPGGVGKTRLVAESVRELAVAWVDAAAVRGRDDFLQAVAAGTGARPAPGDDVVRAAAT
jgi:hypothetical protein